MGKSTTNLIVILGFITMAFAGYYLYGQRGQMVATSTNTEATQEMLRNAQIFIGHRETLSRVKLDVGFFEDERLRSLDSYTTPVKEQPVGRTNPFSGATIRTTPSAF
ncbi:MAG: hypothetical protein RL097_683 [Candidatus Parcubacteria bacterium]|jgi:hypothetical protein